MTPVFEIKNKWHFQNQIFALVYHETHFVFVTALVSFSFGYLHEKTRLNSWNVFNPMARIHVFCLLVCYLKAYRLKYKEL
jgi:hypothetical protein